VSLLNTGRSWQEAVDTYADKLGLRSTEVAVAGWSAMEPLRKAGIVRITTAGG
jgi:hypothetical protein